MFKAKKDKDFSKLERVYEKYKNIMYKEAYNILCDAHDAEDALQQTFMKLLHCMDKIDEAEVGLTCNFLKIVVRNVAKDIYKKRIYLNTQDDVIDTIESSNISSASIKEVSDAVIEKETSNRIIKAIGELPESYREIILLEKIYGYSRDETVILLGENYETLKKRMTRAKTKLLEILRKEGLDDGRENIRKNAR